MKKNYYNNLEIKENQDQGDKLQSENIAQEDPNTVNALSINLKEDQMNLYFGKNNYLQTEGFKKKIRSAKEKYNINKDILIKNDKKKSEYLSINANINSINNVKSSREHSKNNSNTLKSKKSKSARNRIMGNFNSRKLQKSKEKSFNKFIRPMSVYSPRKNTCSFYFSNTFSDYYKEDLKTFSEKTKPILYLL